MATTLCRFCAFEHSDCKGNKSLEKLHCDYFKKPVTLNAKKLAEENAKLKAEVDKLKEEKLRWKGIAMIRGDFEKILCEIGVMVVRCKDCAYQDGDLPCPLDALEGLGDDGYCSRGKRREE